MSTGSALTGEEILQLVNAKNTAQKKFATIEELATYIVELGVSAEVIQIAILQDISRKLDCLPSITKQLSESNKYLRKIYNPF